MPSQNYSYLCFRSKLSQHGGRSYPSIFSGLFITCDTHVVDTPCTRTMRLWTRLLTHSTVKGLLQCRMLLLTPSDIMSRSEKGFISWMYRTQPEGTPLSSKLSAAEVSLLLLEWQDQSGGLQGVRSNPELGYNFGKFSGIPSPRKLDRRSLLILLFTRQWHLKHPTSTSPREHRVWTR